MTKLRVKYQSNLHTDNYSDLHTSVVVPIVVVETVQHETPGTGISKGKPNTEANQGNKSKESAPDVFLILCMRLKDVSFQC